MTGRPKKAYVKRWFWRQVDYIVHRVIDQIYEAVPQADIGRYDKQPATPQLQRCLVILAHSSLMTNDKMRTNNKFD